MIVFLHPDTTITRKVNTMNLITPPTVDLSKISADELMELRRRRVRDRRLRSGSLITGRILSTRHRSDDNLIELFPDMSIA